MSNQNKEYLFALLSVLFWSTVATAFKITLRHLDFLQLLFFSSFVSTFTLFLIILSQRKFKLLYSITLKELLNSIALGFLNPFLYYLILFKAYSLLPAQEALTLNYTWAIVVVILSIPLLKQKISLRSIIAIVISFAGVIIISTHGNISTFKFSNPFGVSLALSSSVIWALFWLFNVRDRRDEIVKLFLNFAFGFIFIFIASLLFSKIEMPKFEGFFGTVYIGLFEMGITFVVWLKALKLSKTTAKVSNLIYLSPFFSLILINFILGEKILLSTIVGLLFIIAGIVLQQYHNRNN